MFIKADEFKITTMCKQEKVVEEKIKETIETPNSTIYFDFIFYDEVVRNLQNVGWDVYDVLSDANYFSIVGQLICPKGLMGEYNEGSSEFDEALRKNAEEIRNSDRPKIDFSKVRRRNN